MIDRGSSSLRIAIAAKGKVEIEPCLKALAPDISKVDLPVTIYISHDGDIDTGLFQLHFPSVPVNQENLSHEKCEIVTTQNPESTSILKLWGQALAQADEEYAAVLDAQCPPSAGWLINVAENIKNGKPVFYGPVEPGWKLDDKNIVGYLTEYAQFKSPVNCESEYPGNNIVFRTEMLDCRKKLVDEGFFKTFMVWKFETDFKQKPHYCENMPVTYFKQFRFLPYNHRRKMHGRCFAATRMLQQNQPPRWACLAFCPFLFILRTVRIYRWIKLKPQLTRAFIRHLPLILVSEISWSYGEFLGYGFDDGVACQHLD